MERKAILRAQDFVVDVRLPGDSDLSWLIEFLHPQFQEDDDAAADCTVSLVVDQERFDELYALGPADGKAELPCFLLDGHTVALPQWNSPRGFAAVREEKIEAFYQVADDGGRIEIVAKIFQPWLRARLVRVIRELMMAHLRTDGWFILHAAAARIDGRTVAIAGPKNSGKTHLLIRLLREHSAKPITFDRLAVSLRSDEILGQGIPTMVSVKADTAAMNADLFNTLDPDKRRAVLTETEQYELLPSGLTRPKGDRLLMSPQQFCQLFDVTLAGAGAVSAIVFPQISETARKSVIRPLAQPTVRDRLQAALFGFNFDPPNTSLFAKNYGKSEYRAERMEEQIKNLADRIAAFDYIVARGSPNEIELESSLLKALKS